MNLKLGAIKLALALTVTACASAPTSSGEVVRSAYWDWQLSEPFDFSKDLQVIDISPDDVSIAQVAELQSRGIKVIAYISVGTLENYRDDVANFPSSVVGKTYGDWPDEKFLDIRQLDVLAPLMTARFAKARDMGFDAIEPDNMDVYDNESGFTISAAETVTYLNELARVAHSMGMEIAQKNVPDLTPQLVNTFDFIITEGCFQDGWCDEVLAYGAQGKDILDAEYGSSPAEWARACTYAGQNGIEMILKDLDLSKQLTTCDNIGG